MKEPKGDRNQGLMIDLEKAKKKAEISLTESEVIFLKECVQEGFYHSEMEDAEQLAISILKKLKGM